MAMSDPEVNEVAQARGELMGAKTNGGSVRKSLRVTHTQGRWRRIADGIASSAFIVMWGLCIVSEPHLCPGVSDI